jgi:hypothetical protein
MYEIVIIVSAVQCACRKKTKALKEKAQKDAEKRNKNYEKMKQKAERLAEKEQTRLRKEREKMFSNPEDVPVMPHRYICYVQNDLCFFFFSATTLVSFGLLNDPSHSFLLLPCFFQWWIFITLNRASHLPLGLKAVGSIP